MPKYTLGFLIIILSGSFFISKAQNKKQIDQHLKKLTSNSFHGRGYVKNGDTKAAQYLAQEFEKYGVQRIKDSYFQNYEMRMNTFPKTPKLKVNGEKLNAGTEFLFRASSTAIQGKYQCIYLPLNEKHEKTDLSQVFLVGDQDHQDLIRNNKYNAKGFIYLEEDQPIWSVWPGRDTSSYQVIKISKKAIKDSIKIIDLKLEPEFFPHYQTQNVWGFIEGSQYPDSIIMLGAHYDHLGQFGNVIFRGANDNASGTVMILELAEYFAQPENKPKYSILFALFSGEEAGLLGSSFMAEEFPFEYAQIKYMINLDMVGAGSEGIKMVNATKYPFIYEKMKQINQEKNYLKAVKTRGESCNSDHCPFDQKGIPAVFIYTLGNETKAYHIPQDDYKNLPLTEFEDLFLLLQDFVEAN